MVHRPAGPAPAGSPQYPQRRHARARRTGGTFREHATRAETSHRPLAPPPRRTGPGTLTHHSAPAMRTANPALKDSTFAGVRAAAGEPAMTLRGTAAKSLLLLLLTVFAAGFT